MKRKKKGKKNLHLKKKKVEIDLDKPPPGKENSDHTKYENLLKDLDKVLIDSVSVRTKFNAIEEMKETAPTDSAIFKGFDSLQSDYIQVKKKIDELCNELESMKKEFSRETYGHKENLMIMEQNMLRI